MIDRQGKNPAIIVEADLVEALKRMALAGEAHIIVFVVNNPRRSLCKLRHQRRHRRGLGSLRLLAAKASAHALADDGDMVEWHSDNLGDDRLHFRWMLRRGIHRELAMFLRDRDSRLRLEIEMLLPAQFKCPL